MENLFAYKHLLFLNSYYLIIILYICLFWPNYDLTLFTSLSYKDYGQDLHLSYSSKLFHHTIHLPI